MAEQPDDQGGGQSVINKEAEKAAGGAETGPAQALGRKPGLQDTVPTNEQIYSMLTDAVTHKVLESQEERKARATSRLVG